MRQSVDTTSGSPASPDPRGSVDPRGSSDSFEALLLKAHPETALIYELGSRLRTLPMPLADPDDLTQKLNAHPVPTPDFPLPVHPCLPPELFPVYDEADLAVKLTAMVRVFLRQATDGNSTARLTHPFHRQLATVSGKSTSTSRRTGFFGDRSLFGGEQRGGSAEDFQIPWFVTLVLTDCASEELLPWSWITDGYNTYLFDANAQFVALIDGMWTSYGVLVMREGYVNRTFVLDQATMAGTTQHICLNRA
ncbi:hypothetical protein [Streptomyces sp. NPDC056013]|uniref:hypothetical protein n=1 Tax=Streptomyces sp. NPDC056013 TaxID=3345680 RepID=UPI0035DCA7FE